MTEKLVIRRGPNEEVLAEARKYPTSLTDYASGQGRYAGDGKRRSEGIGMILAKCDWCGKRTNFRRKGHRICKKCWEDREDPGGRTFA